MGNRLILIVLATTSCTSRERSGIEIIKYDKEIVSQIASHYDSTYTETPKGWFWTIQHYLIGRTKENIIARDSLGNVTAIEMWENGVNKFVAEYFPNGQLRGKLRFISPDKLEKAATYYYEDGRIKSTGQLVKLKPAGQWKEYDKDGFLVSVKYYDREGNLEREEKVK